MNGVSSPSAMAPGAMLKRRWMRSALMRHAGVRLAVRASGISSAFDLRARTSGAAPGRGGGRTPASSWGSSAPGSSATPSSRSLANQWTPPMTPSSTLTPSLVSRCLPGPPLRRRGKRQASADDAMPGRRAISSGGSVPWAGTIYPFGPLPKMLRSSTVSRRCRVCNSCRKGLCPAAGGRAISSALVAGPSLRHPPPRRSP